MSNSRAAVRQRNADHLVRVQRCAALMRLVCTGGADTRVPATDKRDFMYLVNRETPSETMRAQFRAYIGGNRGRMARPIDPRMLDVPIEGTTLRVYLGVLMLRIYNAAAEGLPSSAPIDVPAVAAMERIRQLLYADPPAVHAVDAEECRRRVFSLSIIAGRPMSAALAERFAAYMSADGALRPALLDEAIDGTCLRAYLIDLADEVGDRAQAALQDGLLGAHE